MSLFSDPPLSLDQQVDLLIEKGLLIENRAQALQLLAHVSYFRLNQYAQEFRTKGGRFIEDTTLQDLVDLYLFDRELKLILFDAIESIEVSIKTHINNRMSEKYGSDWYERAGNFRVLQAVRNTEPNEGESYARFDHGKFLSDLASECTVDSKHHFIAGYKRRYSSPGLPPSWMIFEILSFGTVSKIYEHLNDADIRVSIAQVFGITKQMLTSWLHSFTNVRNICAHHSRLVYTSLIISLKMPTRNKLKFLTEAALVDNRTLYAAMACIQHMLGKMEPGSNFSNKLRSLIDANPQVDYERMGFTLGWRDEEVWA